MPRPLFSWVLAPSTFGDVQENFALDDSAQLGLDVALHSAMANGDSHCGTEYLLYGLVATARDEIAELVELFALNTLRVDRAIERLVARRGIDPMHAGQPRLTTRATTALLTQRLDDSGPTGTFEVLHGILLDDRSGACAVLRDLGVQPDEVRRLVLYGIRHLSQEEVDDLLASLDRRSDSHKPWWGPDAASPIAPLQQPGATPLQIASSESATVELTALGSDGHGLGLTLTIRSHRSWVLPPVFMPEEALIPGRGATYNNGPDFCLLQLSFADGTVIDNRQIRERYASDTPSEPVLHRIGQRDEFISLNDRRQHDRRIVTGDWWIWPAPVGEIDVRVDWPAEAISGEATIEVPARTIS